MCQTGNNGSYCTPDARRRQLLTAATTVFARRGYRAAGISDIVATAGVARGTFYLYFASKAEVFLAIADDFYDRLEIQIAQGGASRISRPDCLTAARFCTPASAAGSSSFTRTGWPPP